MSGPTNNAHLFSKSASPFKPSTTMGGSMFARMQVWNKEDLKLHQEKSVNPNSFVSNQGYPVTCPDASAYTHMKRMTVNKDHLSSSLKYSSNNYYETKQMQRMLRRVGGAAPRKKGAN